MKTVIFDLDGTIIDSSHRFLAKPDGSLDLDNWIANCTHEKIGRDKLLPLVKEWHNAIAAGWQVIICTARELRTADYVFLQRHSLFAHRVYCRPDNDRRPDHIIKREQIAGLLSEGGVSDCIMFDDNAQVREEISQLGVEIFDPIHYNTQSN